MKKKKLSILLVCLICLFIPKAVFAHPGRTNSSGCHTCKTNCAKWGLTQGEYHCHSGNTYKNSKGQVFSSDGSMISSSSTKNTTNSNKNNTTGNSNNNAQQSVVKKTTKSSDNTLKSMTIDGKNIELSDKMNYKTKKEKVDISVKTNDSKATYSIDNHSLKIGTNTINIKVTAEKGNVRNYSISIDREKLSNNTNIKIMVDDEKINFVLGEADVNVSSDTNNLNYTYELEDKNAKVKVEGDKDLKSGENTVIFTVTAEDGTEAKYNLKVNKYTETDETMGAILGLATTGGIGYGTYHLIKKMKKK